MPKRQVVEYECERCTRTWYEDAAAQEQKVELKLSFSVGALSVTYNCLCEGCTKTVGALALQISKVMKKSAPIRGAKKTAEKPEGSSTVVTTTTVPAVAGHAPSDSVGGAVARAAATPSRQSSHSSPTKG